MELNPERWYVRLFFWSLGIWDEFTEKDNVSTVKKQGTNLCFFIRVIVLYMPVAFLANVGAWVVFVGSFTVAPVHYFGGKRYLLTLLAVALLVALIIGLKWSSRKVRESAWFGATTRGAASSPKAYYVDPGPGFWQLVWLYVVAGKKKFCPSIRFPNLQEGER